MDPDCVRHADRALRLGETVEKSSEKFGHGLSIRPGGRGLVRQGLQTSDDRRGTELPGKATGTGPMSGVREISREKVPSYSPPDPERRGKRGFRVEGQIWRRGKQSQDI